MANWFTAELLAPPLRCRDVSSRTSDDALLRELYREHALFLLSYVQRLVNGDWPRAEDVVQETLLRAWRHPEAFTEGANTSVRGWLVTVARRVVIDGARARRARPTEVAEVEHEPRSTGDETEAVVRSMLIADAMSALSGAHQDVIQAMYHDDLSVASTAARLGIAEGTVKSRAYYALRALRAACEERGITP